MASPALAMLAAFASRRSLFFFRARAFLPDIAMVCVRVVVRHGASFRHPLREFGFKIRDDKKK
jgi:hypothetical protein